MRGVTKVSDGRRRTIREFQLIQSRRCRNLLAKAQGGSVDHFSLKPQASGRFSGSFSPLFAVPRSKFTLHELQLILSLLYDFAGSFTTMLAPRASLLRHHRTQLCSKQYSRPRHSVIARLLNTLAILEQREGQLNKNSLSAVTAARKLGGPITGFIAGSNVKPMADEAAKVQGVEKIVMVENGSYDKVRSPLCLVVVQS